MNSLAVLASQQSLADHWRVILAVALVIGVATLSLTHTSSRLRRHRALALFLASGWVAIGLGVALGPSGLRLVDRTTLDDARPLAMLALAWIGLIVGLQSRRSILSAVPRQVWRVVLLDVAAATALATVLWLSLRSVWPEESSWSLFAVVALACGLVGWSPETRSFGLRADRSVATGRTFVQASSGLASLALVVALCIVDMAAPIIAHGEFRMADLAPVAIGLVSAFCIAIGAHVLLVRVERHQPESLVLLLGVIALISGVADRLDLSPIVLGAAVGATLTNLSGASIRDFQTSIARAEPALATVMFLMTGMLLGGATVGIAVVLTIGIVAYRALLKPLLLRHSLGPAAPEVTDDLPLRSVTLRPAPLALAIACSIVLVHGDRTSTVLASLALAAAAGAILLPASLRKRRAEAAT